MKSFLTLLFSIILFSSHLQATENSGGFNGFSEKILGKAQATLGLGSNQQEFLHPDQAFVFSLHVRDPQTLVARWDIAKGYYLYRDKFKFTATHPSVELGKIIVPEGQIEEDPSFGKVEINTGSLQVLIPLIRKDTQATDLSLQIAYQGCAKDSICYPPIDKLETLKLPEVKQLNSVNNIQTALTSEENLAQDIAKKSLFSTLVSFFGFGLLLSLTPCVFPMVPILSGIIAGHSGQMTAQKGFLLSLTFVVSSAVTYALAGILAALFGNNLQAIFQNKFAIIGFAILFVFLAFSMFGVFKLQLPASLQQRITRASNHQQRGSYTGVAVMGLLSALIVGPCVAPPLAGALVYIGQTGDVWVGGLALFMLGLGMGGPLLLLGASAGKLLPKAGLWMEKVQHFFGLCMLGLAIWFLERILPGSVTLFLWGLLLIITAIFLGAIDRPHYETSQLQRVSQGFGITLLIYGGALIVGASAGSTNIFRPLDSFAESCQADSRTALNFKHFKGLAGLEAAVKQAGQKGKLALVDIYADWCVECKDIERDTFGDPKVRKLLKNIVLLKADITANDEVDKNLLKSLGLYGPPALLFFDSNANELRTLRVVGYIGAKRFTEMHLNKVTQL